MGDVAEPHKVSDRNNKVSDLSTDLTQGMMGLQMDGNNADITA